MTDPTAANFKPGDRVWFADSPASKRSGTVLAATPMISNEHVPIVMDDNGATCHVHRSHVFAADPTAEPSQRDQYREALAQAILAWFHDGATSEWPGEIDAYRSLAGSLLAVRDAEMEQLRADVEFAERYGRRAHTAWLSASRRAHEYRQAAAAEGDLADEAARERDAARAELAGLRERAVILTKRVRYVYDDTTWDGWLVTLTVAETGTQATVRRDNGEDWVVMARNIVEIPAPEPATPPKRMLRAPQRIDPHAATIDPVTACGRYEPRGELGGVVYTLCLNCGLGIAAHGSNPNGDTDA